MPAGRPTVYTEEMGETVIEHMRQGYSLTAASGKLGVSRQTVYRWATEKPEFNDALEVARAATAAWWEDRGREIAQGGEGNPTLTIFGLKNRVADEWREKSALEHSGPDGEAINTKVTVESVIVDSDKG